MHNADQTDISQYSNYRYYTARVRVIPVDFNRVANVLKPHRYYILIHSFNNVQTIEIINSLNDSSPPNRELYTLSTFAINYVMKLEIS